MTKIERRNPSILIMSIAAAAAISVTGMSASAMGNAPVETSAATAAGAHQVPVTAPVASFGPEGQFQGRFLYNGVRMRTGPGTQYAVKGLAYRGQRWLGPSNIGRVVKARVTCPPGHIFRWSNSWKLVYNPQNRVKGWVNSCFFD